MKKSYDAGLNAITSLTDLVKMLVDQMERQDKRIKELTSRIEELETQ